MEDVELMSHHGDYYLLQQNLGPVEWMLAETPLVRLDEMPQLGSDDVWAEVRAMVDGFARAGHDALFVDATPPDLREAGWWAVKTLVPGSVRHEYGHGLRYLACPRIYEAAVRIGRRARPATPDELNPDAHPYS
jgi:ribosomal protein S12 methylthiotransferase accessory factor